MLTTKSLSRTALAVRLAGRVGVNDAKGRALVDSILRHISEALARGEVVKIHGFGKFELLERPARLGRNLITKETVLIPPRRVVRWRPSKELRVNLVAERPKLSA